MKSKIKKAAILFVSAALCLVLCGCDSIFTATENLLSPPDLTGEMQPISEALKKSVKGEYMLVHPSSGDIRSAIAQNDIDGDGIKEAFAFYSTNDGETTETHINYIRKADTGWKSVSESQVVADGVEKIEFCDLDGDGISEITVGFELYGGSEKMLGVYSANKKKLTERLMEKYTAFTSFGGENGNNLLFLQTLNVAESENVASVYDFSKKGVNKTASCLLDSKAKLVREIKVSKLTGGETAIYLDEEKGAGSITEVLFLKNGELVNPLFDGNKGENTATIRNIAISSSDMNGDGIPEIPTAIEIPAVEPKGEKSYYTNWCSFDGETLTVKTVTVMNQTDGYYLILPTKLYDNIAILRDNEMHSRVFYSYDKETAKVGKILFALTAVKNSDLTDFNESYPEAKKIYKGEQTTYMAELYSEKVTENDIKKMFMIME